jgi:protein-disulfide isomerase
VVNRVRRKRARRPRVYTIRVVLLVLTLAVARPAAAIEMIGNITVEPTMVKGPATAPVTIVEFSDYQ